MTDLPASIDPTTPGSSPRPTALGAAAMASLAGTPAAVTIVWLLQTYGTAHGQPLQLDAETAAGVGAFGAGVIAFTIHVVQGLWSVLIARWLPPDSSGKS